MSPEHDPARDRASGVNAAFLTSEELAARLRISPRTLERWRANGDGPAWVRLKRRVIYPFDGVLAYERARRVAPDG